jgi:hypothetical protein
MPDQKGPVTVICEPSDEHLAKAMVLGPATSMATVIDVAVVPATHRGMFHLSVVSGGLTRTKDPG